MESIKTITKDSVKTLKNGNMVLENFKDIC